MELSKKTVLIVFAIATIPVVPLIVGDWVVRQKIRWVDMKVRSAVRGVVIAQMKSRITGEYWENEMVDQFNMISNCGALHRIEFLKGVILTCPVEDSRATVFSGLVGKEPVLLKQSLIEFKKTSRFRELPASQCEEVDSWIGKLEILAEQQAGK